MIPIISGSGLPKITKELYHKKSFVKSLFSRKIANTKGPKAYICTLGRKVRDMWEMMAWYLSRLSVG